MSRHLADRPRSPDTGSRLRHFLRLDRAEGMHPAIRALHANRPEPASEGRLKPFLRLLRGRPA